MSAVDEARRSFLGRITEAIRVLDGDIFLRVADRLEALPEGASRAETLSVVHEVVQSAPRAAIADLLVHWLDQVPELAPGTVAWMLRSADATDRWHRYSRSEELVWTGPAPPGSLLRRTDQALLEVVRSAREKLLIVSFAAFKVPMIHGALVEAADRGLKLSFLFESGRESQGRVDDDPARILGPELRSRSTVYVWPFEMREQVVNDRGHAAFGLLHAKCAIADDTVLFVSSANFTGHALSLNMELGVLIRGGALPKQAASHFAELTRARVLVPVELPDERR